MARGAVKTEALERPVQSLANWKLAETGGDILGIEILDLDSDGQQEVALLYPRYLELGRLALGIYTRIDQLKLPAFARALTIDGVRLTERGHYVLAVSLVADYRPSSLLVEVREGALEIIQKRIGLLLRRIDLPAGEPVLVGQRLANNQNLRPTYLSPKYRVEFAGGKIQASEQLDYPEQVDLFGFQPFVAKDGHMLYADISEAHKINVYDSATKIWESQQRFGGTTVGFEVVDSAGGNSISTVEVLIEPRLDLGPDGELLVPLNEGAKLTDRYSNFGPSQVIAMHWSDGSLRELWRTPQQEGGMVVFRLADVDNDGVDELVVAIVDSPPGPSSPGKGSLIVHELQ